MPHNHPELKSAPQTLEVTWASCGAVVAGWAGQVNGWPHLLQRLLIKPSVVENVINFYKYIKTPLSTRHIKEHLSLIMYVFIRLFLLSQLELRLQLGFSIQSYV